MPIHNKKSKMPWDLLKNVATAVNKISDIAAETPINPQNFHHQILNQNKNPKYPIGELTLPVKDIYLACSKFSDSVYGPTSDQIIKSPNNLSEKKLTQNIAAKYLTNDENTCSAIVPDNQDHQDQFFDFGSYQDTNSGSSSNSKFSYLVNKDQKYMIIAFRGTDNLQNWMKNVEISSMKMKFGQFENCSVHKGFGQIFEVLQKKIVEIIKKYHDGKDKILKTVIFTGHSLGGALANLNYVRFSNWLPNIKFECITFGAPRVGDQNFEKAFQFVNKKFKNGNNLTKFGRFVYKDDIVPTMPNLAVNSLFDMALNSTLAGSVPGAGASQPSAPGAAGYVHVVNSQHLDGNVIREKSFNMKITGAVEDHKIGNYLDAIEKLYG